MLSVVGRGVVTLPCMGEAINKIESYMTLLLNTTLKYNKHKRKNICTDH